MLKLSMCYGKFRSLRIKTSKCYVLSVTQCRALDFVNFTSVSDKFPKNGFL